MNIDPSDIRERLREAYRNRTDREQKLLVAFAVIMPVLVVALLAGLFYNSLDGIRAQTEQYRRTLDVVTRSAPEYLRKTSGESRTNRILEKFPMETIEDNDIQLRSFLAQHADVTDVNIRQYDEDTQPIGDGQEGEEGIIEEQMVTASIRSAQFENLLNFLERIDTADKPVVLKRLEFRDDQRDKGKIRRIQIVVATYNRT